MSLHDEGRAPKAPMIPRVSSGRQRELEGMIASEIVRWLPAEPLLQFQSVIAGIQAACMQNGIVLTEEPFTRPGDASGVSAPMSKAEQIAAAEAHQRARKAFLSASLRHLDKLSDQPIGGGDIA